MFAVIHRDDVEAVRDSLNKSGYHFTRVDAQGGLLRHDNVVSMVVVAGARLGDLERMTASICRSRNEFVTLPWTGEIDVVSPIEVTVGGATMLVLEMEKAIRI